MTDGLRLLGIGDPAPDIVAPTPFNPRFNLSALGGRYTVLILFGRLSAPGSRAALEQWQAANLGRDDYRWKVFGVTAEPADLSDPLLQAVFPDQRVFMDANGAVATAFGALGRHGARLTMVTHWLVLDPQLRVVALGPLSAMATLTDYVRRLPRAADHAGPNLWAPVILVTRVLEPDLCQAFIAAYRAGQPEISGFMDEENGRTVSRLDAETKRRTDVILTAPRLREALRDRVARRIAPQIRRAFCTDVTRIERFIVACYDASDRGHFKMHRDNTTSGTAHRKFAVTINLNAEDFDGGELTFPEYGDRRYKAPTGGAIVFSCSLLHQAEPVTAGTRYATLPFLYDEAGAAVRLANNDRLAPGVAPYLDDGSDLLDANP